MPIDTVTMAAPQMSTCVIDNGTLAAEGFEFIAGL
jgi:hypothetical protein